MAALACGRIDDGIADFERALVLRPDQVDVLVELANALAFRKRHDEAIAS
jgi:hypothetical protein